MTFDHLTIASGARVDTSLYDAGESGIGNVQVELLLASSDAVTATQMTAADGVALFDPVAASQSHKLRYDSLIR